MSTRTVAEKLLVKPGTSVWVSHPDRRGLLDPLPADVRSVDGPAGAAVAVVFADGAASVRTVLEQHRDTVTAPPVIWIAYPKGGRADINRDTLWPIVAEFGLRPNGQVAIDDVWSALRFRATKPGEPPFTGGAE
ncbi:hypothetical protein E1212_10640 [Jiangella ureilytica]|uniref:DUF3052 domain-containing protein n=1 Tax=Jiangella ureilytica TaxID=2530374 RepID=A0A4R4RPR1_9ACTN|nr:hypothetical protein [Jiangella ureilytica]TDC51858.1 hypothetical protein E1212_10640 [Jiangella ureilytica]